MKNLLLGVLTLGATSLLASSTCEFAIEGTDAMTYSTLEMVVPTTCKSVKVTLTHAGTQPKTAMGHNWILSETKHKDEILMAAFTAGPMKDYLPKGNKKVIAHTKLLSGGEKETVSFSTARLKKGGDYSFFCSFPGHAAAMTGKLIFR